MIDQRTGSIHIADDIAIGHNDNFDYIKNLNLGQKQEIWYVKNGVIWITERNIKIEEQYFIISFAFFEEKLNTIVFVLSDEPSALESTGWDNYSEIKEREDAKKYDAWLTNEIGSEREFKWGRVYASYDPKSGGSSIGIVYE